MKTLIALSTALLLLVGAPVYASGKPPVNQKDRHAMIFKKKKHKKAKALTMNKNKMMRKAHKSCSELESKHK